MNRGFPPADPALRAAESSNQVGPRPGRSNMIWRPVDHPWDCASLSTSITVSAASAGSTSVTLRPIN